MCEPVTIALAVASVAASAYSSSQASANASAVSSMNQSAIDRQTAIDKEEFDKRMGYTRDSDARVSALQDNQFKDYMGLNDEQYDAGVKNATDTFNKDQGYQKTGFDDQLGINTKANDDSYARIMDGLDQQRDVMNARDAAEAAAWTQHGNTQSLYDTLKPVDDAANAGIDQARDRINTDYGTRSMARSAYNDLIDAENHRQAGFQTQADQAGADMIAGVGRPATDASGAAAAADRKALTASVTTTPTRPSIYDRPDASPMLQAEADKQIAAGAAASKQTSDAAATAASYGDALSGANRVINDTGTKVGVISDNSRTSLSALSPQLAYQRLKYGDAGNDISDANSLININRSAIEDARSFADRELAIRDAAYARGVNGADVIARMKSGNIDATTQEILNEVDAQRGANAGISGSYYGALRGINATYGGQIADADNSYYGNLGASNNKYYGGMIGAENAFTSGMIGSSNDYQGATNGLTQFQVSNTRATPSVFDSIIASLGSAAGSAAMSRGMNMLSTSPNTTFQPITYKPLNVPTFKTIP